MHSAHSRRRRAAAHDHRELCTLEDAQRALAAERGGRGLRRSTSEPSERSERAERGDEQRSTDQASSARPTQPSEYFAIASAGASSLTSPRRASSVSVASTTDSAS